ncbi:hypothetical protein M409DRAFT_28449 [Zasmidium cellare ATCC 36951]|uniref:Mitochondrial inner membrane protease subunit n=1 Tax=Zasmidium cellare ATCC 36951 TaxID=1080233 RepID=A0A6A6C5V1_ZASCE|nr:uncharacterized protein M409DRAFT_28449 [Zasmidium cellare ATCC 36951]KAF2161119.1 hypothetical protein M409DRAFT_28449 [Zasmidium cellare ATCC 36951]
MASPPLRSRIRGTIWYLLVPFHLSTTSLILLNDNLLEYTTITGSSMSPTLSPDYETTQRCDGVLWKKWRPTRDLRRGDVVFFSAPHNPEGTAVKRVVALGGDTVLLDPKRRPKEVENGRTSEAARKWDVWKGRVVVPPGHVWVEGDNWRKTKDSNDYGPVSKSLIQGKAWCLYRPYTQFGSKPWEGYKVQTKVIEGKEVVRNRKDAAMPVWEPHG